MRPINPFDLKDVRDYNSNATLNAVRNSCVRAKELDDKQGTKQKGTYFVAMLKLSDAIRKELGAKAVKAGKAKAAAPVVIADSEEYKKLEVLLTATQERSVEQESELEDLDKDIESKDKEITELMAKLATPLDTSELDSLNKDAEVMALKIKELTASNKKLTAANKKLTKGDK